MRDIWLVMKITFKEGVRSRILFGITFLAILLFASNLVITNLFFFELGKVMVDIGFSALSLSGLSIVFFLGIGLLSRDIHDRTVYMVISRPVTRWQYVVGKFGGLALTLVMVMGILGALALVSFIVCSYLVPGAGLPRNFSWANMLITVLFNFLSLLVVMSFAFFFTIISSSMYLAMLFTFCVYFIGHSLETIVKILVQGELVKAGPSFIFLMKGITWIFPNLSAFDLKASLAYGLPQDPGYLLWTGIYGCTYSFLVILVTVFIFQRKDIC